MTARSRALPQTLAEGLASSQLPCLDGIRAIAVFLVVFYHFGLPFVSGSLGVLIFFVLSGFLITWLLLKENERYGDVSLGHFYARRALRIFPAFYCYWCLVLGLWLFAWRTPVNWPQAIASAFYVNNYYQALHGDPNTALSHTWSLGIEEQFYLLWPVTFLFLRSDRRRLARALTVTIIGIWLYRLALAQLLEVSQRYIYEAFDTRADHLAIGCLLAVLLRGGFIPWFWRSLCAFSALLFLAAGLLVASVAAELSWGSAYRDSIGFIVDPLLVAILIVQTIAFRDTALSGWLNWGWMRFLGRISYSVYLYQQITVYPAKRLLSDAPSVIQLVGVAAAVTLVASGSYFVVEAPFLRWKSRFGRIGSPRASA